MSNEPKPFSRIASFICHPHRTVPALVATPNQIPLPRTKSSYNVDVFPSPNSIFSNHRNSSTHILSTPNSQKSTCVLQVDNKFSEGNTLHDGDFSASIVHPSDSTTTRHPHTITTSDCRHPPKRSPFQLLMTTFPWRNVSFLVGVFFKFGALIFVINGFFFLILLVAPSAAFPGQTPYATGITSILGNVFFVMGGFTAYLEGLNLKSEAIDVLSGIELQAEDDCSLKQATLTRMRHKQSSGCLSSPTFPICDAEANAAVPNASTHGPCIILYGSPSFIYAPTARHFRRPLFIAGFISFIGTLIFASAAITGVIPSIVNSPLLFKTTSLLLYTLASFNFVIASAIQQLQMQDHWWDFGFCSAPSPGTHERRSRSSAWYVAFAYHLGSWGFLLGGALAFFETPSMNLGASLANLLGSVLFVVGGALQWRNIVVNET